MEKKMKEKNLILIMETFIQIPIIILYKIIILCYFYAWVFDSDKNLIEVGEIFANFNFFLN
jgi:hypothetical protein